MRFHVIVIVPPSCRCFADFAEVSETLKLAEFVANAAVKALDVRVLRRLTRVAELQR
jgi:hypothetical protein